MNTDSLLRQRLSALGDSLTMQQGITQKSLAQTLSTEAERNFELHQAAETLSVLAAIPGTEPVIVQCKVEKAACHRLAGELEQCKAILDQLRSAALPTPECRLRTEAEWIRYHIASGTDIAEMRRLYAADHADAKLHPDFDLARLELFLVNDPQKNIRPEITAAMKLEQTLRQLSTYWGRRAGKTMSAMTAGNTDLASAEMLATLADKLYQEQQYAEAAAMYEQAAERADTTRQAENMYRYNRSAVAAWSTAIEHLPSGASATEYEDRLIPLLKALARQNPNHPEALGLHVTAIQLLERHIEKQPEVLDECKALIEEHEKVWAESPVLPTLRRLLIVHLERQGRTGEAVALLPLLNGEQEQLDALPTEIKRLRVRQLDAEGKTQEAVDLLTAMLKQKREFATLQLLAEILSQSSDVKNLNDALNYWGELAQGTAKESEQWWSAREGIIDVLIKLNRQEEAKKSFDLLRITNPKLGGAERRERLMKRFGGE
jgi:tetratricopeptide (TPR) repeat protein